LQWSGRGTRLAANCVPTPDGLSWSRHTLFVGIEVCAESSGNLHATWPLLFEVNADRFANAIPPINDRGSRAERLVDMALGFYFGSGTFTPEQYDDAIKQLEAAGAGAPAGRLSHVALESGGQIQIFDVWESQEAFEAFGATLMPILGGLGVDPGQPMVSPVHNIIDA
jgi:hypothetical protein